MRTASPPTAAKTTPTTTTTTTSTTPISRIAFNRRRRRLVATEHAVNPTRATHTHTHRHVSAARTLASGTCLTGTRVVPTTGNRCDILLSLKCCVSFRVLDGGRRLVFVGGKIDLRNSSFLSIFLLYLFFPSVFCFFSTILRRIEVNIAVLFLIMTAVRVSR